MALHRLGGVCDAFWESYTWAVAALAAAVVVQTIRLDNIISYYY